MKRFLIFVLLVALCVTILYQWNEKRGPTHRSEKFTPARTTRIEPNELRGLAGLDEELPKLVDSVVPSVVSITTSRRVRMQGPTLIDPFQFFGRRFRTVPQERIQNSLGSGVIV